MTGSKTILFIDAYDSFAENIAALLQQQLDVSVTLIRIDCDTSGHFGLKLQDFLSRFDGIVLGPGPGNPGNESDVGLFNAVWDVAAILKIPVLGICLGFQSLCTRFGLPVIRLGMPCHGHAKQILHADTDVFQGCGDVVATNYNSLGVRRFEASQPEFVSRTNSSGSFDSLFSSGSGLTKASAQYDATISACDDQSKQLKLLAWDVDDWVMAVRHTANHFHGFQFHPESCKSNAACQTLLRNWWESANLHNEQHRIIFKSSTLTVDHALQQMLTQDTEAEYIRLGSRLDSLGKGVGNNVNQTTLSSNSARESISQLCYDMSRGNNVVMLESTRKGRYSIYPFPDESTFRIEYRDNRCQLITASSAEVYQLERPGLISLLESFILNKHSAAGDDEDVPFTAGFMGYFSYEFGADSLNLDVTKSGETMRSISDLSLVWIDRSIVMDHQTETIYIQSLRRDDQAWTRDMAHKINAIQHVDTPPLNAESLAMLQSIQKSAKILYPDHDSYISQIRDCQSELLAGNSYELCLTTEASISTPKGPHFPWLLYKNIQRHNPVPYAAYVRLGGTTILSSSPEHFLSWSTQGTIDMIPMKGTVRKGGDMTLAKAKEILASAKESAENLMIADLIRHDLYSTVTRDALVEVVKLCDVIETETVYTMVSHIRAHVPMNTDIRSNPSKGKQEMTRYGIKALTRTLPPGSMTGAPKKRSCEILHRLEQRHRGVYSGAIGYMDVGGHGSWNVCIRSAFASDCDDVRDDNGTVWQKWRIGAGGAITVLSDEEQEWDEMVTKLESVVKAFRAG